MTTTWNPSDASPGKFTFSNANLTATSAGVYTGWNAARATSFKSTGKWYFEFTANAYSRVTFGIRTGLANASASLTAAPGSDNNGVGWEGGGSLYQNSVQLINGTAGNGYNVGDTTAVAVDLDNHLIWVWDAQQSKWNNSDSANPGAGTGGISFTALGACTPVIGALDGSGATAGTLNTGAQTFAYQPPFGFFNWDGNAALPDGQTMLQVWARSMHRDATTGLWSGGNWTNKFGSAWISGGPTQNQGGVSIQGATIKPGPFGGSAVPLYLTASGTGDAGLSLISSPPFFLQPPFGFAPGWPGDGGFPGDHWDATSCQGSASVTNNYQANFGASQGLVQSQHGVTLGSYYFEYLVSYDIFSQDAGIGIGRKGVDITAWFGGGGFSTLDANGGVQVNGGNGNNNYQPSLQANKGASFLVPPPLVPSGQGMAIAVNVGPFNAKFVPQPLMPTPLVCIPCVELVLPNQNFRNRFGA